MTTRSLVVDSTSYSFGSNLAGQISLDWMWLEMTLPCFGLGANSKEDWVPLNNPNYILLLCGKNSFLHDMWTCWWFLALSIENLVISEKNWCFSPNAVFVSHLFMAWICIAHLISTDPYTNYLIIKWCREILIETNLQVSFNERLWIKNRKTREILYA